MVTIVWSSPSWLAPLATLVVNEKIVYAALAQIRWSKLFVRRKHRRICKYISVRVSSTLKIAHDVAAVRKVVSEVRQRLHVGAIFVGVARIRIKLDVCTGNERFNKAYIYIYIYIQYLANYSEYACIYLFVHTIPA